MEKEKLLKKRFREQKGKCFWCNKELSLEVESISSTGGMSWAYDKNRKLIKGIFDFCALDHIIPKSLGGNEDDNNFVLSCNRCNQRKSGNIWIKNSDGSITEFCKPKKITKIEYKKDKIIITTIIKLLCQKDFT